MEFAVWVSKHSAPHQLKAMAPAVLKVRSKGTTGLKREDLGQWGLNGLCLGHCYSFVLLVSRVERTGTKRRAQDVERDA